MILLYALLAAVAAFGLLIYGGRHEPTAHGQEIIGVYALLAGIIVFFLVLGGYGILWAVEWFLTLRSLR